MFLCAFWSAQAISYLGRYTSDLTTTKPDCQVREVEDFLLAIDVLLFNCYRTPFFLNQTEIYESVICYCVNTEFW